MRAKVWKPLICIFILIFVLSASCLVHAATANKTIKVGSAPWGVAYDSSKNEIFVVESSAGTVKVLSDSNNAVLATITVGQSPYRDIYDSGKGEIFVANYGADTVSVISDSTNRVVATVPVGTQPSSFAYDSSKGEVFVANSGGTTVSIISDTTNTVIATVTVGNNPYDLDYDSATGQIFVANAYSRSVSVVSDSNNQVVATVPVGQGPLGVAYDPVKGEVFVANSVTGTVSLISDITDVVVATVTVGSSPGPMVYDSNTGDIYAVNRNSGTVSVISDATNNVSATFTVGSKPYAGVYDSGRGEIIVTNYGDGTLSLIYDSTHSSTSSAPSYTGTFTFKAWIDGYDYLYIREAGTTVWYYHVRSDPPGFAYNGLGAQYNIDHHDNKPTYIDGTAWQPTWANITTTWVDVQSLSDTYVNSASLPTGAWNITSLTNVVARDNLSVLEYPSASNGYTAKILLDDWTFLANGTNPMGADWYSFTLNWISTSPLSGGDLTKTAWVPPAPNGAATVILASVALSLLSVVAAAATTAPASAATSSFLETVVEKIRGILPDAFKKWLEDLIASKRKLKIGEKKGSPFLPTKPEIIVYAISIILLTISFSYVKVSTLEQFLIVLPTFFGTSILVALIKTYVETLYSRSKGVWTEFKLWYFGIGLFLVTTFAFKAPFSSPTRTVHHSRNFTDRIAQQLAVIGILITLAFGALFFVLLEMGQALIGGTGLAMCIIGAFFDTYPIEPMGGKDIYKYDKRIWAALFVFTLFLYVIWLAHVM